MNFRALTLVLLSLLLLTSCGGGDDPAAPQNQDPPGGPDPARPTPMALRFPETEGWTRPVAATVTLWPSAVAADAIQGRLLSLPDVVSYSRRTGTQLGFFITEPNIGDYVIDLKPRGQRRPLDDVVDELRDRIAAVEPALRTDFGQLLEDDIGDLTGGEPQPIDIKVFGTDQALLQKTAQQIAQIVADYRAPRTPSRGIIITKPPWTYASIPRPRPGMG